MGVSITANKSRFHFNMGYGGFLDLRANIADSVDKELGRIYSSLRHCYLEKDFRAHDEAVSALLKKKPNLLKEFEDIIEFLYAPDAGGKIGYKTCRKIAKLLEPKMPELSKKCFRYSAYADHDYEDLLEFLRECAKRRWVMYWY